MLLLLMLLLTNAVSATTQDPTTSRIEGIVLCEGVSAAGVEVGLLDWTLDGRVGSSRTYRGKKNITNTVVVATARTDTTGLFFFENVKLAGRYEIQVGRRGPRAVSIIPNGLLGGGTTNLGEISLRSAHCWTGRVQNAEGKPVQGAMVRLVEASEGGASAALRHRPGDVYVHKYGIDESWSALWMPDWMTTALESLAVPVTRTNRLGAFKLWSDGTEPSLFVDAPGYPTCVQQLKHPADNTSQIRLQELPSKQVRIVSDSQEPLAGIQVAASYPGDRSDAFLHLCSESNSDGMARIPISDTGQDVLVGLRRSPLDQWTLFGPSNVHTLDVLSLNPVGSTRVYLIDPAGRGVEGAEIQLVPETIVTGWASLCGGGVYPKGDYTSRVGLTNEDGMCCFEDVPFGRFVAFGLVDGLLAASGTYSHRRQGSDYSLCASRRSVQRIRLVDHLGGSVSDTTATLRERGGTTHEVDVGPGGWIEAEPRSYTEIQWHNGELQLAVPAFGELLVKLESADSSKLGAVMLGQASRANSSGEIFIPRILAGVHQYSVSMAPPWSRCWAGSSTLPSSILFGPEGTSRDPAAEGWVQIMPGGVHQLKVNIDDQRMKVAQGHLRGSVSFGGGRRPTHLEVWLEGTQSVTVADDGTFSILRAPPGPGRLHILAGRSGSLDSSVANRDVNVVPGSTTFYEVEVHKHLVDVCVLGSTGTAIEAAEVEVASFNGYHRWVENTDHEGRCDMVFLDSCEHMIRVRSGDGHALVGVSAESAEALQIRLSAPCEVSGTVIVDPTQYYGRRLSLSIVSARAQSMWFDVDYSPTDSAFRAELPAGDYLAFVDLDDERSYGPIAFTLVRGIRDGLCLDFTSD